MRELRTQAWERWSVAMAFGYAATLILLARLQLWPGWASVDEEAVLAWLRSIQEGAWPPFRLGQGWLHQWLLALGCGTFGWDATGARLTAFTIFLAGCAALGLLTKRWAGERAAAWGLLVHVFAAFSLTQGASLLSFSLTPLQVCLMLLALPYATGRALWALLWGAMLALLAADYEGWLLAIPGLALAFVWQRPTRRVLGAAVLGLSLGAALLAWGSAPFWQDMLAVRRQQSIPHSLQQAWLFFGEHLRQYFLGGGHGLVYLGPTRYPSWPLWALPGLLLGLYSLRTKGRSLGLLLLLPFAGLLAHAPSVEPNRVAAAWPLLCLSAGAGLAQAASWLDTKRTRLSLLLLPLLLVGAFYEARAYLLGLNEDWGRFYHESTSLALTRASLAQLDPPPQVLCSLRPGGGELGRFALSAPFELDQSPIAVLIPWSLAATRDPAEGRWQDFRADESEAPVTLLFPTPAKAAAWVQRELRLRAVWDQTRHLPPAKALRLLRSIDTTSEDPWVRAALWEQRLRLARVLGQESPAELLQATQSSPAPAEAWLRLAQGFAKLDPPRALRAAEQATRTDPRRRDAWRLQLDLLRAQGHTKQAEALGQRLNRRDPRETFEPGWLKD